MQNIELEVLTLEFYLLLILVYCCPASVWIGSDLIGLGVNLVIEMFKGSPGDHDVQKLQASEFVNNILALIGKSVNSN